MPKRPTSSQSATQKTRRPKAKVAVPRRASSQKGGGFGILRIPKGVKIVDSCLVDNPEYLDE